MCAFGVECAKPLMFLRVPLVPGLWYKWNMPESISLREFARRLETSHVAIRRKILDGTISAGVSCADGKISIADPYAALADYLEKVDRSKAPAYVRERADRLAADREAERASRGGRPRKDAGPVPAVGGVPPRAESEAREKHWKAELAELRARQAKGELLEAGRVQAQVEGAILACRAKLLALPSQARQRLPHLTAEDAEVLDALVRETLEDLAVSVVGATGAGGAGEGSEDADE